MSKIEPGPNFLSLEELAVLFGYSTTKHARAAIAKGSFPVPTYLIRGSRVADKDVVNYFFERLREEGIAYVDEYLKRTGRLGTASQGKGLREYNAKRKKKVQKNS